MKKQVVFSILLIFNISIFAVHAQNWNEIIKTSAADASSNHGFGISVDIDGDYAIVGAYTDNHAGSNSGSAYIFVRSGSDWIEQDKLTASDAAVNDNFGRYVAIDGDYAIVGSYFDDDGGSSSGSAYIFKRSGTNWSQEDKLTASDATSDDLFGSSVAINGNYAIVGAYGNDDAGSSSGSAYVFVRSGSTWLEQQKLTAFDAATNDRFGASVAISGNYAIVGASQAFGSSGNGSAYVFLRSGNSWSTQTKLTGSNIANSGRFGSSVSMEGNYAIIGAPFDNTPDTWSGSAYIFLRSGTNWSEQAKLIASDSAFDDRFGLFVSISGDYAIIGAISNDDAGSSSGSAYVFSRSGSSWSEQTKLIASDAASQDNFGKVAIDGDYAIVGADGNDDFGFASGSAYIFEFEPITSDIEILTDITADCSATPTAPTANGGTITATADVTFPITTQGTTVVTWTYDDGIGNTLAQTQNVIIEDTSAPSLAFADPADATIESCADELVIPAPEVSDNCSNNRMALDFDGVNDQVDIPLSASLSNVTEFTIEGWFNQDVIDVRGGMFGQIISANQMIRARTWWDGFMYLYVYNGAVSYGRFDYSSVVNAGEWFHFALVFDGNNGNNDSRLRAYVNGQSVPLSYLGTIPSSTPDLSASSFVIAENFNIATQGQHWSGAIDEFRIWDTARTATEILDNKDLTLSGNENNLIAYYDFEDGMGSSVLSDQSGNTFDGTLTNMDINSDWVQSLAPISTISLINDFNGSANASGTYPPGETTVTWTATDAVGNQSTLEQIITIDCGVTYTFNNGVWSPSDPNGNATADDDLIVASGNAIINTNTTCNSVTINPGAGFTVDTGVTLTTSNGLTLESISTNYSSLILDGSIVGNLAYQRHVNINGTGTTGSNDLVSAPLTGQAFSAFAAANPNLFSNTAGDLFLFGPYEKTAGEFLTYADTETATLDAGVGYRAATDDNGTLTFTGTAENGVVTNNIINTEGPSSTRPEWNLVGNPYPSYLNVQDFLNHDVGGVFNIQLFDAPTAAIYGYDGTAINGWVTYNLATTTPSTLIAPGQGFFVSADATNSGPYDLTFTPAMRSTGTGDDFIAGRNAELVYVKLKASTANKTYGTDIYFNNNASLGFDLGYDAALWDATIPDFALYSSLVQDNTGDPMTIQAVSSTNLSDVVIPLGVNANQGEQITFSISEATLPASVNVYLDDVVANTTTLLNSGDYVMTPNTNVSGTGRFFLRTSEDALSTIDNNLETLNIFALNSSKEVVVSGLLQESTNLELYDIQGRVVLSTPLDVNTLENRVDVSSLSSGVYVIRVNNTSQSKIQKVILK